jgi:hypothetical protein
MSDKPHIRRLAGLTTMMLGLTAVFASLTLVAVSKPGLAGVFAVSGVVLVVFGLRLLPTATP